MVRKTKEAALATREALIDAAERAFRRRGVTRTSLADVATEAGMTRGAIYWHFRDKAELLEAMCRRTAMPLDAALEGAAGRDPVDPLGELRSLAVDALVRLARDRHAHAVFEILFHKCEFGDDFEGRAAASAADPAKCIDTVLRLVRIAITRGQLPLRTDPLLATRLLHAGVHGLMQDWVRAPGDYDLAAAAPSLVDALIAGLCAAPPVARRGAGA